MTIIEQVNQGIKDALRNQDKLRLDTLRMLKSKVLAVDARASLPDPDVIKLFKSYFGSIQEALKQAQTINRPELVDRLHGELKIIEEFLPKMLSPEETQRLVSEAIAKSGAKSKKELGLVMRSLKELDQPIDSKLANELARQLLPD